MYYSCFEYLDIHFFDTSYKTNILEGKDRIELDINKGYLPCDEEEVFDHAIKRIENELRENNVLSNNEIDSIIVTIYDEKMGMNETLYYLDSSYGLKYSLDVFSKDNCMRPGTSQELNVYIKKTCQKVIIPSILLENLLII